MTRSTSLFAVTLLLTSLLSPCWATDTLPTTIVEQWLAHLDHHEYQESWQTAAHYLQRAIPAPQWTQTLVAHREPFGKVIQRQHSTTEYKGTLPGIPNGQYAIAHFLTSFEKKDQALETVVMTLESNGTWKAIGYTIK
ncbi:MAG: DUF4019 domain-containing protein [Nitrospirota bacterium]